MPVVVLVFPNFLRCTYLISYFVMNFNPTFTYEFAASHSDDRCVTDKRLKNQHFYLYIYIYFSRLLWDNLSWMSTQLLLTRAFVVSHCPYRRSFTIKDRKLNQHFYVYFYRNFNSFHTTVDVRKGGTTISFSQASWEIFMKCYYLNWQNFTKLFYFNMLIIYCSIVTFYQTYGNFVIFK